MKYEVTAYYSEVVEVEAIEEKADDHDRERTRTL